MENVDCDLRLRALQNACADKNAIAVAMNRTNMLADERP
jgi:hypothetical protein